MPIMDGPDAIEICEALFEKYGVSEEDKDWLATAMAAVHHHMLLMQTGQFYEAHQVLLAEKGLFAIIEAKR